MFKQANRLTKHKDFTKTFKQGQANYGKLLGVKALQTDLTTSRFSVVAGLKISKKAIERNRAKRQVREILTKQLTLLKPGYDLVVICLPTIVGQESATIKKELDKILNNLKLYK